MDPSWIQRSVLICFFRIFARMKKIQKAMTHGTLGTGKTLINSSMPTTSM